MVIACAIARRRNKKAGFSPFGDGGGIPARMDDFLDNNKQNETRNNAPMTL